MILSTSKLGFRRITVSPKEAFSWLCCRLSPIAVVFISCYVFNHLWLTCQFFQDQQLSTEGVRRRNKVSDCPRVSVFWDSFWTRSQAFTSSENPKRRMESKIRSKSLGVTAMPVIVAVQLFGVTACVLVLVWCIHYRGGLAFHSSTNKQLIFNLHPVFMFVGFIFLASQGIIAYKIVPARKGLQKAVHLVLHGVAIIMGAIGIYAVFKFHNESKIKNLYSLHSWFGISAISLFGLQWLGGFVAFLFPGASKTARISLVPWHSFLGLFAYLMAITAAETGILEKLTFQYFSGLNRFSREAMLVNSTGLIIFFFAVSVVLSTLLPR